MKNFSAKPRIDPAKSFPKDEFIGWLLRQAKALPKRVARVARPPQYDLLAKFAYNLGVCVRTSVDIVRGLELCLKRFQGTRLGDSWSGSVQAVRHGSSLADALSPGAHLLPVFYLPVIKAGEEGGRLDDALAFLESHCKLLAGPASALRNIWLYPLLIMLVGSILKVVLVSVLASPVEGIGLLVSEVVSWLKMGVIVAVVFMTPVRYFIDQIRLTIPLLGNLEREIALHRFFRVLALLYSVGGQRVEVMIRTAADTVSNHAAKTELLKAATAIEQGHSIPEAFRAVSILTRNEHGTIEVGELSGTLEKAFDNISDETGANMISKLELIQPFFVRLVMTMVIVSLCVTMLGLLN